MPTRCPCLTEPHGAMSACAVICRVPTTTVSGSVALPQPAASAHRCTQLLKVKVKVDAGALLTACLRRPALYDRCCPDAAAFVRRLLTSSSRRSCRGKSTRLRGKPTLLPLPPPMPRRSARPCTTSPSRGSTQRRHSWPRGRMRTSLCRWTAIRPGNSARTLSSRARGGTHK